MTITLNPSITTVADGLFSKTTKGLVQGFMMDDPTVRNLLAGGLVDPTEELPMWGGLGICEHIPLATAGETTASDTFGGYVTRATNVTANAAGTLTGFTVFNQLYNGIITPQSNAPLVTAGMGINFFRLGSQARIAVKVAPELLTLDGGIISPQVSWDFGAQRLAPYQAAYAADPITGASWAGTNGGEITFTTQNAHGLGVGVSVTISGFTPDGYNGTFITKAGTTGSTIVVAKAVDPGSDTVQGQLDAGGGALNVRVLEVSVEGNLTVDYDPATNFATWNRNGPAALILI